MADSANATRKSVAADTQNGDIDAKATQEWIEKQDLSNVEKGIPNELAQQQKSEQQQEDYSSWTVPQKRAIILAASFAAWFSPMSASIYFPALDYIAKDLHVSATEVNLTVTTYLIIQGLAPMMIAGFSDKAGRRPAYIICFVIYLAANLGLGLQDNYAALLVLRMLQSAGGSGTIALAQGVAGDLVTSAERGTYIAWASFGTLLGPTLSPVIGGLISQYLNWHWIFWFLLILSGAYVVPFLLFFPETCRNIVGDGSVPPPSTSWNLTDHWRYKRREKNGDVVDQEKLEKLRQNHKLSIPNPISTLLVLTSFEAAILLLPVGMALACYYAISTGASDVFSNIYHFNQLDVGLIFLSIGFGTIVSTFTTGKLVDMNYRRYARKLNFPIVKNKQTDLSTFPIERARLEVGIPILFIGAFAVIGYGWVIHQRVSLAGPIIMLVILGYCLFAAFQALNVLMVDIYPGKPASASAASNVARCLLGAGSSAAIQPMSAAMGTGLAYTVLALLFILSCLPLFLAARRGMSWRQKAKAAEDAKKENQTAR